MKSMYWFVFLLVVIVLYDQSVCCGQDDRLQESPPDNGRAIGSLPYVDHEIPPEPDSSPGDSEEFKLVESPPSAISPAAEFALNLLFGNKVVQKEIELTRTQLDELRKIQQKMEREIAPLRVELSKSMNGLRSDGRDNDKLVEITAELEQAQIELATRKADFYQQVEDVLSPRQMQWLQQAATQMRSLRSKPANQSVLMSEHLVEALGINADQLKTMQRVNKESQQELKEIIALHRSETHRELMEVLSEEQRKTFAEIFGEKIDF